jgi:hypothetical protein
MSVGCFANRGKVGKRKWLLAKVVAWLMFTGLNSVWARKLPQRRWQLGGVTLGKSQVIVADQLKIGEYSANRLESLAEWRSTPRRWFAAFELPPAC